jgi:hypothetical protein
MAQVVNVKILNPRPSARGIEGCFYIRNPVTDFGSSIKMVIGNREAIAGHLPVISQE